MKSSIISVRFGSFARQTLNPFITALYLVVFLAGPLSAQDNLFGDGQFGSTPTLYAWNIDQLQEKVNAWLEEAQATGDQREQVEAILAGEELAAARGPEVLLKLADLVAIVDADAAEVVDLCKQNNPHIVPPGFAFLTSQDTPALVRNNIRLLYGRWLCQARYFDECLTQLDGLQADQVADPGSLFFYKSVAYHRLSMKEPGLESLAQLINEVGDRPHRYDALAEIMHHDLTTLEDGSLDEISRWMDDVERRLDLGRTGTKVRGLEDQIVQGLDKIIEELEKQQGSGSGGGSTQSSKPANDSNIMGGSGPGEVDRSNIGSAEGWGTLPPKDRQEALQQIGQEFPPQFRAHIERYFRRLADEGKN
ncbi:MAG: hypothetical protein MPJ50_16660 [Pirellulales bacterium]|nr:hypothetical protein [Pirellulales bacterium]